MGFRNGAYATVWEVKPGYGNWTDVKLSISRKNKDGNYETDFSGYVRFIGEAGERASQLEGRSRIKIKECDVSRKYDKERDTTYTNFAVFSFDNADERNSDSNTSSNVEASFESYGEGFEAYPDMELPFTW